MKNSLLSYISFFHSRKLYLVPPFFFVILFLLSLAGRRLEIYPGLSRENISVFDDHETDGNSIAVMSREDDSGITLNYTLREKIQYPYSGIKMVLKTGNRYKDLSRYDYFSVELTTKTDQETNIFLHTIIPGFTDESKALSYRYLLKTVKCTHPEQEFTFPLKSFTVPTWWYVLNKFPDDSLQPERFKLVAEIIIENGNDNRINIPYSITVHKVAFLKSIARRGLTAFYAVIAWIIVYSLIYLLLKNYRHKNENAADIVRKIVIPYESLDIGNDSDDCLARIVTCIAKKYSNQDLSLNQVAREVGVAPVKITRILKEEKNCSYKQYLNSIRLTEAKRLLLETDRNIVDIAQKVGYGNVTHFNRIFKETEGISPRQYRASDEKKQSDLS